METEPGLRQAAQLFKVLGNESRLGLLRVIEQEPRSVGALAAATGMSQPLVSQHLRTLRQGGLVIARRRGKEMIHEIADRHVTHVIADALTHALEPVPAGRAAQPDTADRKDPIMTDIHAEHTVAEHAHGEGCGHETVPHGDHVDYVHGTHRHALHGDHYDEHESVAEHTVAEHAHGEGCGHGTVEHGDHVDYLHDGHRHAAHEDHYDEH